MQVATLTVRGFRNLADAEVGFPASGMALVGPNGHGKTNVLEALAYPVLFRSVRGAPDRELARFGGTGFHVEVTRSDATAIAATWSAETRRKRIVVAGVEQESVTPAIGHWLAVAFLPTDLALVQGAAAHRRRWLDRMLSLSDRTYLEALLRYRAALSQRNAALRRGTAEAATAFDPTLARVGATVVSGRLRWLEEAAATWQEELAALGEEGPVTLRYRGDDALTDATRWPARLEAALPRDLARGHTHLGPHRDDLDLGLGGRALRDYGSTGQQRVAAIALRLLELETLTASRGERPCLLVDDVFAELDGNRQALLATRLGRRTGQRVVTAPREEDLPAGLELPRWQVREGRLWDLAAA